MLKYAWLALFCKAALAVGGACVAGLAGHTTALTWSFVAVIGVIIAGGVLSMISRWRTKLKQRATS